MCKGMIFPLIFAIKESGSFDVLFACTMIRDCHETLAGVALTVNYYVWKINENTHIFGC